MIVVSDTTAITTLLKADEVNFLKVLFDKIIIPQAVWNELMAFHTEVPEFVSTRAISHTSEIIPALQPLGRGEAEAIQLAREIKADLLLIDDRKARHAAAGLGIECVSLVALVVQARQRGQIPSARSFIEKLETQGGLYLADAVKSAALRLAGE